MASNGRYSLRKIGLQYAPQESVVVNSSAPDMNLLANSFKQREERKLKALNAQSNMDATFAKIKEQLHNDEETLNWWSNKESEYKADVASFIKTGDYGSALEFATQLGAQAVNDGELIARMKTNQQYNDWVSKTKNRTDISDITKRRLIQDNKNQYKFTKIYDTNGNVSGGEDWIASEDAVQHLTQAEIIAKAKSFITPYENTYGKSNADGTGKTSSTALLKPEQVESVYNAMLSDASIYNSLKDEYKDEQFRLKEIENQLLDETLDAGQKSALISEERRIREHLYDGSAVKSIEKYNRDRLQGMLGEAGIHNTKTIVDETPSASDSAGGTIPGINPKFLYRTAVTGTVEYGKNVNASGKVDEANETLFDLMSNKGVSFGGASTTLYETK